jgi:hypothetical protein
MVEDAEVVECTAFCGPTQEGLLDVKLGRGDTRPGLSTKIGACKLVDGALFDAVFTVETMMSVLLLEEWQ